MDDLLPVSALTRPLDRFRCEPFRATLTVKACLSRQQATYAGGRMKHHGPKIHAGYPECLSCELGKQVAARVPSKPDPSSTCSVCGAPVTGAGRRKPLCPKHRHNAALAGVSR